MVYPNPTSFCNLKMSSDFNHIPDLVVRKVNAIKLVHRSSKVLYHGYLVASAIKGYSALQLRKKREVQPEVQFSVPDGVDVLPSSLNQVHCQLNHSGFDTCVYTALKKYLAHQ